MDASRIVDFIEIPNFVDQEYCQKLIDSVKLSEKIWRGDRREIMETDIDSFLISPVHDLMNKLFINKHLKIKKADRIQRSANGFGLDTHSDSEGLSSIIYGLILYLNNDYTGGYLVYPSIPEAVKPEPGKLVIHRGDIPHFVSMFNNDGERYFISAFIVEEMGV